MQLSPQEIDALLEDIGVEDVWGIGRRYAQRLRAHAIFTGALDVFNMLWGGNTIFFGAQGLTRKWKMRQERRSDRYTTHWSEILCIG